MVFAGLRVHFIGIGGVSMEALAKILGNDGAIVTGSDSNLETGHTSKNIHKDIDFVVINGAISDDNVEIVRARKLGLEIIDRSDLLAAIEARYINRIAVAGTHGKSTTVAMIGAVMQEGGLEPTVHNGARPSLVTGGKDFFVTEACEFRRSFLKLKPTVAVITNIEADHMDCYSDLEEIKDAFNIFAGKADTVISGEGAEYPKCNEYKPGYYCFQAFPTQELRLDRYLDLACSDTTICLGVPGRHNVMNACLAVRVGLHFDIEMTKIKSALENFAGIERRFQKIGETNGAQVIVDYAHHPTEIETTIETADRIFGKGQYLVVYQPHTYTRTLAFFDDFVRVLSNADCVLYKTFSAREKPAKGGTGKDIANAIGVRYFASETALRNHVKKVAWKYKAIILTGAGDIYKVYDDCLKNKVSESIQR